MFLFDQHVPILLEFRAMDAPVSISVPGYVLRYLDTYAERSFAPDGNVVYRQPSSQTVMPALRQSPDYALPRVA